MQHTTQVHDEQALIAHIVRLENDIERAESARANSDDVTLSTTLRQLRRRRAVYLSVLLGEAQPNSYSLNAA